MCQVSSKRESIETIITPLDRLLDYDFNINQKRRFIVYLRGKENNNSIERKIRLRDVGQSTQMGLAPYTQNAP